MARALALSKQQLAGVAPGPQNAVVRQSLGDQIQRLQLALHVPPTVARQIDRALPPGVPSAPKPVRNAFFAFIISLVLAIAVAFGLERFDRRLKRPEELSTAFGMPVLAVIPHSSQPALGVGGASGQNTETREGFRILRANIELAGLDAPSPTIVVSSAMPGEGKSTVVRNLALVYAETGKSVAVVDADLRRPSLAKSFGVPARAGLTDVLRHQLPLDEAMIQLDDAIANAEELGRLRAGHNGSDGNGHRPAVRGVTLLASGMPAANPASVLAPNRMTEVLDELSEQFDVVLIDSAPLLPVADTVPLLRYAGAFVLVGRLGVTTRDTSRRLSDLLARVPDINPVGIVANDLSRFEATGSGYGGTYVYGYGDAERMAPPAEPPKAEQPA